MFWTSHHRHISFSWPSHCGWFLNSYSLDSFGNALNIPLSTLLRLLPIRLSHSSPLTFANVSTVSELTMQYGIWSSDRQCELMKLPSVGIWRRGFWFKYTLWIFGNRKNVSGWRDCSLLRFKCIYCKLTNTLHASLSKCSNSVVTLNVLLSYIYGAPCKAKNCNLLYIWTYIWQRWKPSLSIWCTMFQHWINAESFPVSQLCVNTLPATKVTLITDGI